MPATEQTWRNANTMHVVFGLTSLGLLVVTILLLAHDNVREWKQYQRKFRDIETWAADGRIDEEQTAAYAAKQADFEKSLKTQLSKPLDPAAVQKFLGIAEFNDQPANEKAGLQKLYAYSQLAVIRKAAADAEKATTADDVTQHRAALVSAAETLLRRAKYIEDDAQTRLKFKRAERDEIASKYGIAVDEQKPVSELSKDRDAIAAVDKQVADLLRKYETTKTHRLALQDTLATARAGETAARKAVDDHKGVIERLQLAKYERAANWKKSLLEMPIIDAFGRPLKVEQIWLPNLTLNNNFRDVARFDRCTTCHQAMDKTAPGSAVAAGFESTHRLTLALVFPKMAKDAEGKEFALSAPLSEQVVGLSIAQRGQYNDKDAAVDVVWPNSPAALAGLKAGDVIEWIGDAKISDPKRAQSYLLDNAQPGSTLSLRIRRGAPQPFSSHPRLDLFVGSLSPHKMGDFGCTICHEGQGSATQFKWVSHTPNDAQEAADWKTKYGWFDNHHWIQPMRPDRFAQSSCLKCHHDLGELEPSERFPDPPAPKLMAGYHLIRQVGCFGCHEINGYDGPNKRRGPDLRAEPSYASYASQLINDKALSDAQQKMAREVIDHPDRATPRKLLAEQLLSVKAGDSKLSPTSRSMAQLLAADEDSPGKFRKVGPSLRHLDKKVDLPFLYDWVRDPKNFRPSTKMPKFFGLHDHLQPDALDAPKKADGQPSGLEVAHAMEPVEIRAIAEYLLDAGKQQAFDYVSPAKGAIAPSAERGKVAFETRGCLACHKHPDFPAAKDTQGPDLGRLGGKLFDKRGKDWLYSWIRQPQHYHARSAMPNLFIEPTKQADGTTVDPAADMVEYLLASKGYQAPAVPDVNDQTLNNLVGLYLKSVFTQSETEQYREQGIPAARAKNLRGDELTLISQNGESAAALRQKKLLYVGRKSIARLGCAGCHDIPGFEDAKPIGTTLADWGRKEPSKLAFEQIAVYLQKKHGHGEHHEINLKDLDADTGYFLGALMHHGRDGFIWQKLNEPRSYDYKKTEHKDYLDRLRMPKFNLTSEEVEQIITFVLGLVAEPPAAKYVYKPTPRQKAIEDGRQLLEQFNCVGCHTIDHETWEFDYKPNEFAGPPEFKGYEILRPHFTPEQLAASRAVDRRGLGHARITGMPNPEVQEDPDTGKPVHFFQLWKNVAINGHAWMVGGQEIEVKAENITNKRPPYGGDLARFLHPLVLATEKKVNGNVKASDAWGWVPPPLVGEGEKVRPEWLYEFLLDPYAIRPAVVLRMPKFNFSASEARILADYFAAKDNTQYPYEFDERSWSTNTMTDDERTKSHERLDGALRVLTDNNYCVKCHKVGDFTPPGTPVTLAPQLDRVAQRLRPEFLLKWLAQPNTMLPYTGMPVNFPIDKPADQKLLSGTSEQQVQSVVDLLLNWSRYMTDQQANSIKARVKPPTAVPVAAPTTSGGGQ